MELDQNKTFVELAIEGFGNAMKTENKETEPVVDYLLRSLGIDYSGISGDRKNLLQKNFVYIMCLVIGDLKLIDSRLDSYKQSHKKYENDKSNAAEYNRRKIEYFSELNKYARIEIIEFLQNGLKSYLLENEFDALKREEDGDSLTKMFMDRRYKFAYLRDYYDMLFDFSTCVKVNYLPGVGLVDLLKVEKRYLDLRRSDESKYREEIHHLVDDKKIMDEVVAKVKNNFHLHKRIEIFEDMASLFSNKHYQSWLFVQNPESDFTRKRKLDFETMLQCLLAMESGSIQKELLEMFRFNPDTATASAFYQQRGKIPITLRIVRFPLSADTYECVITKLPNDEFPPDELKKLYAMRWGIETLPSRGAWIEMVLYCVALLVS